MKKIQVIKKLESDVGRTLTQAEREIKYNLLAEKNPEIDKVHFDNFRDMEH